MKTIRLFGQLGKRFGRVHKLAVKTPAEAMRALAANFPGFESYMIKSQDENIAFRVSVDSSDIEAGELRNPFSREIHVVPRVIGAGNGTTKLIIGAVLIVAGAVLTATGVGGALGGYMIQAGIGLALSGVVQLLSPVPTAQEPDESDKNKPSYVFNGPVNTTAQGQPVPIGYGRLVVGGAVISAGIVTEQLMTPIDEMDFSTIYK